MTVIPQADPARRINRFRSDVDAAVARVLGGNSYILGPAVEAFETAFATYLRVGHCIGVGSGTDALTLILRALNIGRGDEVITVALTAAATAQAISLAGAEPRFVDVDLVTRCMDPTAVEAAITSRTAALLPVHLYGQPADIDALLRIARRHGLALIEDCAQAHGATIQGRHVGSFGDAAAFSFYPTKNLGCVGDGGAVVCNDARIADTVRSLRNHGWINQTRVSHLRSGNSRLDEIQAAILMSLLPHLDGGNRERRVIAGRYRALLRDSEVGLPPDSGEAIFHQFAITCRYRDRLRIHLRERASVLTAVHYDPPLHRQPAFKDFVAHELVRTERLASSLISLPIQHEVAGDCVDRIATALVDGISECIGS